MQFFHVSLLLASETLRSCILPRSKCSRKCGGKSRGFQAGAFVERLCHSVPEVANGSRMPCSTKDTCKRHIHTSLPRNTHWLQASYTQAQSGKRLGQCQRWFQSDVTCFDDRLPKPSLLLLLEGRLVWSLGTSGSLRNLPEPTPQVYTIYYRKLSKLKAKAVEAKIVSLSPASCSCSWNSF